MVRSWTWISDKMLHANRERWSGVASSQRRPGDSGGDWPDARHGWLSLELRQLGLDGRALALVFILPDVAPLVEVCGAFQADGESLGSELLVKLARGRRALPQAPLDNGPGCCLNLVVGVIGGQRGHLFSLEGVDVGEWRAAGAIPAAVRAGVRPFLLIGPQA